MISMIEHEIKQDKSEKFEEKSNLHEVPSELLTKPHIRFGPLRQGRLVLF